LFDVLSLPPSKALTKVRGPDEVRRGRAWSFSGEDKKLVCDSLWVLWFFLRYQLLLCSKQTRWRG
jgi:hypothetical protein